MAISVGDKLPEGTFLKLGDEGVQPVELSSLVAGKRVVMFGLPGPFTGTCTTSHVPSFIRTAPAFRDKSVDHIICFAVTDPWVMDAWATSTGGADAGIEFLADGDGSFTRAIGMNFDAPAVGFHGRTVRHAMFAEDGVVKVLNKEERRGVCEFTAGETLLEQI